MGPPRSEAWRYFNKRNEKVAQCKKCFKDVQYCGNTSNLHKHLKTHPDYTPTTNVKISKRTQKETDVAVASTSMAQTRDIGVVEVARTSTSQESMDWDRGSKQTLKVAFEKIAAQKEGGVKYNNINMCILYFICKDMRPFNVVEGEGLFSREHIQN